MSRHSISVRQLASCMADAKAAGEEPFSTIKSYWANPEPFEAEAAVEQARLNARIDDAMRRARERRAAPVQVLEWWETENPAASEGAPDSERGEGFTQQEEN